jgi:hypothetical protein
MAAKLQRLMTEPARASLHNFDGMAEPAFITELPSGVEGDSPVGRPALFGGLAQFSPDDVPVTKTVLKQTSVRAKRPMLGQFHSFKPGMRNELNWFMPSATATPVGASLGTATAVSARRQTVRTLMPIAGAPCDADGDEAGPSRLRPNETIDGLRTAWDAIEYFARGDASDDTAPDAGTTPRFVYLNMATAMEEGSVDFRPYDLIVTDRFNVKPEHYTMSAQGMCHVLPGEESEFVSLSEWSSNAVAYTQCAKIPFFRCYTLTKGFHTWRINVRYKRFCAKRSAVQSQLFATRGSCPGPSGACTRP